MTLNKLLIGSKECVKAMRAMPMEFCDAWAKLSWYLNLDSDILDANGLFKFQILLFCHNCTSNLESYLNKF